MTNKVRVGVIGVGIIGKQHLISYAQKMPDVEVVAICDIDESELARVAELHKIRNTYINFRDLLKRDDIEAVDVCVHNNLHMPISVAGLQAGKNVYCEKPMAGAYADALTMYKTAQALDRKLSIQLNTLFEKPTKAAKAMIAEGLLGHIYHARSVGHRRRGRPFVDGYGTEKFVQTQIAGGGALYDMGVYHISMMLYLLGNPAVLRISGQTYQELAMDPARRAISGYNVEELGLGFVKLAGGLSMDIIEAWAINLDKLDGSAIFGSKGGIRLDPFGFFSSVGDIDLNAGAEMSGFDWRLHSLRENADGYDSAQQHWVAALQGRVELLPTAQLALNTMLISEGIYQSSKLGREVTAEEVEALSVSTAVTLP